jgi:hypothetical protein
MNFPIRFYQDTFGFVGLIEPGIFFFDMKECFTLLLPSERDKYEFNGYVSTFI